MTEEAKKLLREAGRQDLIDTDEINQSGYAGINRQGMIVDRRQFPDAVPVQQNPLFNVPAPKDVATKALKTIGDISLGTPEGRYLIATIAMLTSEGPYKTPEQVLEKAAGFVAVMFDDQEPPTTRPNALND